jgi:phosphatidylglycerophosphatase A
MQRLQPVLVQTFYCFLSILRFTQLAGEQKLSSVHQMEVKSLKSIGVDELLGMALAN